MFCKYKIEAIDKDYYDGIIVVYNFEVEDNHNYYVGDNQVLVHNDGGCTVNVVNLRNIKKFIKNLQKNT